MLLDEINRCNVPKVLGDLLTTVENSKRLPWNEELAAWDYRSSGIVTLPYSERLFSVPENVYIVGTMNTMTAQSLQLMQRCAEDFFPSNFTNEI